MDRDCRRLHAFGREDLACLRSRGGLEPLLLDVRTAVAEAVRLVYFAGDPRTRNVRIRDNYQTVDYWDGSRWWMMGIREAVDAMTGLAVRELEHCVDWSETLPDETKREFERYMEEEYRARPDVRQGVRAQAIEVMIRPFPLARD